MSEAAAAAAAAAAMVTAAAAAAAAAASVPSPVVPVVSRTPYCGVHRVRYTSTVTHSQLEIYTSTPSILPFQLLSTDAQTWAVMIIWLSFSNDYPFPCFLPFLRRDGEEGPGQTA